MIKKNEETLKKERQKETWYLMSLIIYLKIDIY